MLEEEIAAMEERIKNLEADLGIEQEDYDLETVPIITKIEEFEAKLSKADKPEILAIQEKIQMFRKLSLLNLKGYSLEARMHHVLNAKDILLDVTSQLKEISELDSAILDEKSYKNMLESKAKLEEVSSMLDPNLEKTISIEKDTESLITGYHTLINCINNKLSSICKALDKYSKERNKEHIAEELSALIK